ncbi:hypothetical protein HYQ46_004428 [Verticillium longisporum]|nr:hypothetical protein HYQ46_004428 [Verticillium longisporum]
MECYTTITPAVIQATMSPADSPGEELHTARHVAINYWTGWLGQGMHEAGCELSPMRKQFAPPSVMWL